MIKFQTERKNKPNVSYETPIKDMKKFKESIFDEK